jgi:O-acetyl-ADP-ribose deacetylase
VRNALAIAAAKGFRSIAFPLVGAGVGGGAETRVMQWMQDEMARCDFAGEVRIVRFRS